MVEQEHKSAMVAEVLDGLAVRSGGHYLDCTVGPGGHAHAILLMATPSARLFGIDADAHAILEARRHLQHFGTAVRLINANFRELGEICRREAVHHLDGVLFDLGLSSLQLADASRGFSFQVTAPLDMRFDGEGPTASDIINGYPEEELANLIWRFGQERDSRRIAKAIVDARPMRTTTELATLLQKKPYRHRARIHPATRTFQALRIAVNNELNSLSTALEEALPLLSPGGRIVIISYHSLEDRIAKQFIERRARNCVCSSKAPVCTCDHRASLRIIHRRARRPSNAEIAANPRVRSARLRTAEKL